MSELIEVIQAEVVDEPSWSELVNAGRVAASSQWTLGDLALRVETGYGEQSLEQYAEEIGVDYEVLRKDRWVAQAFGFGTRVPNLPWSVHRAFAGQSDRVELIKSRSWTVREARELVAERVKPALPPRDQPGGSDKTPKQPSTPHDQSQGEPKDTGGGRTHTGTKSINSSAKKQRGVIERIVNYLSGQAEAMHSIENLHAEITSTEASAWEKELSKVDSELRRFRQTLKGRGDGTS